MFFYQIFFLISENKNGVTDPYCINNDHEAYIKLDTEQAENTKSAERQRTTFPKTPVENEILYKPALNQIMSIHE